MVYVLIAFVMLLVIGPVLMLRPTEREKRQMRLRECARSHQVTVQPLFLRRNKQYSGLLERNPHLEEYHWFRYQLVAKEEQTGPAIKGEWVQRKTREGKLIWEPRDIQQPSSDVVDRLLQQWHAQQSVDFLSLELGPRSVTIVWNERGDLAEAEALCTELSALIEA